MSLAEIMTGSLLAPQGLKNGILAIIIGHLIGCLILVAVGVIGFRERQPALVSSRISLGKYGSYLVSVFNIIQLIGWTAIMLIQCARSLQSVTFQLFGINSFALLVVLVGVLVAVWALCVDKGISLVNNVAVVLLAILSLVMLVVVVKGGEPQRLKETISFGTAMELSIVMPLSWVPLISDYTRSGKTMRGSCWGSFLGYFIGSSLMYIIGLTATVYTGITDPVGIMAKLHMGYSALLIVILATVTTTFLDVYSSVMSTLNLVPGLSKKRLIVLFATTGTLLALFFPMEEYESFLYLIGSLFAPAFSVVIVDYYFYRTDRSGDGFNVLGVLAALIGTAAYYVVSKYDLLIGSSLPAMLITVGVYIVIRFIASKIRVGEDNCAKENC